MFAALKAGASGYVLKGVPARELLPPSARCMRGEVYVAPPLAGPGPRGDDETALGRARLADLTLREREVLEWWRPGSAIRRSARD